MNIRDLQYLVAVADHKHFGKAAQASFVSQPTLSAQLKKLEEYLGVQLIERSQRQVLITPIGEEIVKRARIILRDIEEIQACANNAANPLLGKLTIGIIPTLAPYLLPHIVPIMKQHFPKIEFYLFEEKTAVIVEQLRQGTLDAIILALPIVDDGFIVHELFSEPFVLALPLAHRLAKRKSVSIDDLNDENLLLLAEGHCFRDQALEVCKQVQIKQKTDFSATSLETLRHMVAANVGITLLPQLAVEHAYADNSQLIIKPFCPPQPMRKIGMLWRKGAAQMLRLQQLAEILKKEFSLSAKS